MKELSNVSLASSTTFLASSRTHERARYLHLLLATGFVSLAIYMAEDRFVVPLDILLLDSQFVSLFIGHQPLEPGSEDRQNTNTAFRLVSTRA